MFDLNIYYTEKMTSLLPNTAIASVIRLFKQEGLTTIFKEIILVSTEDSIRGCYFLHEYRKIEAISGRFQERGTGEPYICFHCQSLL